MAVLFAKANHNWSARNTNNWTTDGGTTYQNPAEGDTLVTNNFTVTVDETTFVIGEIKNGATTSGGYTSTAGGKFSIGGSYTLKVTTVTCGTVTLVDVAAGATAPVLEADVINGTTTTANIFGISITGPLTISGAGGTSNTCTAGTVANTYENGGLINGRASGSTLTLTGALYGGSNNYQYGIHISSSSVVITGNVYGGSGSSAEGIRNASGGSSAASISITGNVYGGGSSATGVLHGSGTASCTITGNVYGSTTSSGYGVWNTNTNNIIINGDVFGGTSGATSYGAYNYTTGTITINGNATGGNGTGVGHGAYNNSTGTITINGAAIGNDCGPGSPYSTYTNNNGLYNATRNTNCSVKAVISGKYGVNGIGGYGAIINEDTSTHANNYVRWYKADESYVHFEDPDLNGDYPTEANVRLNTTYAGGSRTGSLAVPNPASVAYGTPTDATVGTAVLTAENVAAAVWDVLRSGHTTASTFGEWGYPGMLSRSYPRGV